VKDETIDMKTIKNG